MLEVLYPVHHPEKNPGFLKQISRLVKKQKKGTLLLGNQQVPSYLGLP